MSQPASQHDLGRHQSEDGPAQRLQPRRFDSRSNRGLPAATGEDAQGDNEREEGLAHTGVNGCQERRGLRDPRPAQDTLNDRPSPPRRTPSHFIHFRGSKISSQPAKISVNSPTAAP